LTAYRATQPTIPSRKSGTGSPFILRQREIDSIYETLPPNGGLPEYWGTEYGGYNLFLGAEIITLRAMMNITGEADQTKARIKIFGETTEASVWFGQFIQNYNSLLLSIFVGMTITGCRFTCA
jgi:hypothetical protein